VAAGRRSRAPRVKPTIGRLRGVTRRAWACAHSATWRSPFTWCARHNESATRKSPPRTPATEVASNTDVAPLIVTTYWYNETILRVKSRPYSRQEVGVAVKPRPVETDRLGDHPCSCCISSSQRRISDDLNRRCPPRVRIAVSLPERAHLVTVLGLTRNNAATSDGVNRVSGWLKSSWLLPMSLGPLPRCDLSRQRFAGLSAFRPYVWGGQVGDSPFGSFCRPPPPLATISGATTTPAVGYVGIRNSHCTGIVTNNVPSQSYSTLSGTYTP
jgi:hypothetical protein